MLPSKLSKLWHKFNELTTNVFWSKWTSWNEWYKCIDLRYAPGTSMVSAAPILQHQSWFLFPAQPFSFSFPIEFQVACARSHLFPSFSILSNCINKYPIHQHLRWRNFDGRYLSFKLQFGGWNARACCWKVKGQTAHFPIFLVGMAWQSFKINFQWVWALRCSSEKRRIFSSSFLSNTSWSIAHSKSSAASAHMSPQERRRLVGVQHSTVTKTN